MKRIMVVDDDKGALKLLVIMLNRSGFEVLKAESAEQALNTLENNQVDMVILDLMMPGMDGFELCHTLRTRPDTRTLPILILSTKSDANSIIRVMDMGATDYLPKPILHHDLVAKVRTMLSMGPATD